MAWIRWIALLGALALLPAAHAETDAASAESLMRRSGLWEQLAGIGPQARAGVLASVGQSDATPSDAELERLARAADIAFGADRLRDAARGTIERGLDGQHLPALLRWYGSAVGTAMTKLEEASSADTRDPAAMMQAGSVLLQRMPEERRLLLAEMVQATRAPEAMVQLVIGTGLAAYRGAASVMPGKPAMSLAELRALLESQRPQMLRTYAALALAGMALTYEGAEAGALGAYLDFLRSDAGRHFSDLGNAAIDAAMVEASAEFGRRLPGSRDQANT
jgi:hypothetical protein